MIGPFYYRVRLAKNAPYSGVKVWHSAPHDPDTGELLTERGERWYAMLNGEHVPLFEVVIEMDGVTGVPVVKGDLVDEVEYIRLSMIVQHAKIHMPNDPHASPRRSVDPLTADLPF